MKLMLSVCIALFLSASALAQSQATPKGDDKELTDLLNILQQETDVATKTRLNTDYVPGIVTLLQGDQLEAMGVVSAWEALGLVPGVQAVLDGSGSPSVVVRGIDFPFNSGNIQILINSVPLSRADSGISASSLLIPIEQVERIEVIRGPGSVVYGDFAFMGLVNIVTRKEGERVYTRDDIRARSGGAHGAWTSGPAMVAANLSHSSSDNTPLPAARGHDDRTFGVLTASNGGFKLAAEEARREFRPAGAGPTFDETSWGIDARYGRDIIPKLHAEASTSYLHNDIDNTTSLFQGHQVRYGVNVISDLWQGQSWLFGADDSTSTTDQAAHTTLGQPGRPPGPRTRLVSNVERRITGLVLQDRVDVSKAVTLTNNEDPATARWLANAGLTFEVQRDAIVGARLNHVENRAGGGGGYDLVDFTVSRQDLVIRGLGLRAGIKDAFNDRPVYLNVPPVGPPQPLVFPGRSVWFQVSWKR